MGYISKEIAIIKEPGIVTLSAVPNFVQFTSKPALKTYLEVSIQLNIKPSTSADIPLKTLIQFTDASGIVHVYHGTTNPEDVDPSTFNDLPLDEVLMVINQTLDIRLVPRKDK